MKKRIFSRALALVMALAMLSTTVFAASLDDLQEAIDGTNDVEVTDDTTPVDATPAGEMPEPSEPEAPEETLEPPTEPTTPTEPTAPADETHVNGALVRQETDDEGNVQNYFGYGWSSVLDEITQETTWYYAIEAHDKDGNRFVVLLDDVSKGDGAASGVVVGQDGSSTNVTIDMNDHNITGSGEGAVIKVETDATLDLSNGTISGGEIGIDVLGNLFLDSVTVSNNTTGINFNDGSKVTFTGKQNKVSGNDRNLAGTGKVTFKLADKDGNEITYKVDTKTAETLLSEKYGIVACGTDWILTENGNGEDTCTFVYTGVGDWKDNTVLGGSMLTNRLARAGIDASKITEIIFDGELKTIGAAFGGFENLKRVQLNKGITTIGMGAFQQCTNLESVNIPESVTTIDGYAFYGCTNLTMELKLPKGLKSIGVNAFNGCDKLWGNVTIPAGVEEIGQSTFCNCKGLNGIKMEGQVKKISGQAFLGCEQLKSINFPETVIEIGGSAFNGCKNLSGIELPKELKIIGNQAFEGCTNLKGVVTIPAGVEELSMTFKNCKNLEGVVFAEGSACKKIAYQTFKGCDKLKRVVLPASVGTFGSRVFDGAYKQGYPDKNDSPVEDSGVKSVFIMPSSDSMNHAKLLAKAGSSRNTETNRGWTPINIYVETDKENLGFCRGLVAAEFGHNVADEDVKLDDGSVALTNVSGTINAGEQAINLPAVAGITASIDTNGNITVNVPSAITVGAEEYPYGARIEILPDGKIEVTANPEPPVEEEPADIVIIPDFSFDAMTADADTGTTIEDETVPLAGLVTLAELLEALREYEGIEDVELPEDFQWTDHDYAQAIYWGLAEALVIDTEDDPLDPDEIVTVALLREVLENFVAYKGLTDFPVTVEGEDDMIVMDLGERLTVFYGELETALAVKAA